MSKKPTYEELEKRVRELERAESECRSAGEELRESRDLLNAAQQLAKVGGWVWDLSEQTMMWTDETYRIHGLTPGEVAAGSPEHIECSLACYDPDDLPAIREAFRRCVEEGQPYDLEFPFTTTDGRRVWIQTIAQPVFDGGSVVKVTGNIMDITDRKHAEEALARAKVEWERTFDSIPDLICILDKDYRILRVNRAFSERIGRPADGLIGEICYEIVHGCDEPPEFCLHAKTMADGMNHTAEVIEPNLNGDFLVTTSPLFDDTGNFAASVHVARDITERKQVEEQQRRLAETDDLTRLWNRRYFMNSLEKEIERAQRYGQVFSLLMLDIDHFKVVNDTYGHAAGDRVLQHFSVIFGMLFRQVDVPARLGGEEFAVLLPQTGMDDAYSVAERFRKSVQSSPFHTGKADIFFTVSIGVAAYRLHISSPDEILKMADNALYDAKDAGRNRTVKNTGS